MTSRARSRFLIALIILCAAGLAVFSIARAASIFDITFPIPELANCADRTACKAYCNDSANQSACQAFAQAHGLNTNARSSSDTSSQGTNAGTDRIQAIQKDGGPGQCAAGASDPEKACRAYCNDTAHIQECVAYGKAHGFLTGDQLQQAEKVAAAIKGGATLPQGCTDQQSCQETCQNPSSLGQARSCFTFAKAAGLLPPGFDEAQAEKIFSAIKDGTAPFSSMKDFQQCDNPTDPAILKKCTDFAVQSGQMTQQQADVVQKTGGKGPGGCVGKDACDQYCTAHPDECFQFAQQNGLVAPEQEQHMQDAANQLKQALDNAPPGAKDCITAALGQDTLNGLLSGTKPGTPQIGQAMQQCFQQMQQQGGGDQHNGNQQFGAPPQGDQSGANGDRARFNDNAGSSTPNGPAGLPMPPQSDPRGRFMQAPPDQNQGGPGGPSPSRMQGGRQGGSNARFMQGQSQTHDGGNWMPPPLNSDAHQMMPGGDGGQQQGPGNFNGSQQGDMMPNQQGQQGMGPHGMGMDQNSPQYPNNFQNGMQGPPPVGMPPAGSGMQQFTQPPSGGTPGQPPSGSMPPPSGPSPAPSSPTSFIGAVEQLAAATISVFIGH